MSGPGRADVTLDITCDEPGVRLFLSRPRAGLSAGLIAGELVLLALLLIPFGTIAYINRTWGPMARSHVVFEVVGYVFLAGWCLTLLIKGVGLVRITLGAESLRVDGASAEIRLVERSAFGLFSRDERMPTSLVSKVAFSLQSEVQRRGMPSTLTGPLALRVTFTLLEGSGKRGVRHVSTLFRVAWLDRREEVVDFALRLGAAAGFASYRITRSDSREIDVELDRGGLDLVPIPPMAPASYVHDRIPAGTREALAQERVPHFAPEAFDSAYTVLDWHLGERVVLRKPFPWGVPAGCLPFVLAPLAVFLMVLKSDNGQPNRALFLVVTGVAFLGLLGLFIHWARMDRPRRVEIDWRRGRLLVEGWREQVDVPLAAVRAVEMRGVKVFSSGGSRGPSYYTHHCEIRLEHDDGRGGPTTSTELCSTRSRRDDPAEPWRAALPLAADLAEALGVERRIIDYS
jgi:hypothetical protein